MTKQNTVKYFHLSNLHGTTKGRARCNAQIQGIHTLFIGYFTQIPVLYRNPLFLRMQRVNDVIAVKLTFALRSCLKTFSMFTC